MFDHLGINVSELARSTAFYQSCLKPLGIHLLEEHDYGAVIFGPNADGPFMWVGTARPSFWRPDHGPGLSPMHLAFVAPDAAAVDAFYDAGLAAGGQDNGPPGLRGAGWYQAFLLDPDGHNIEAAVRPGAGNGRGSEPPR